MAVPQNIQALSRAEIVAAGLTAASVLAKCHSLLLDQLAIVGAKLGQAQTTEKILANVSMIGSAVDRSALPDTADLTALDEVRKRLRQLVDELGSAAEFVVKLHEG